MIYHYTKGNSYILPAGDLLAWSVDGIYVNGDLFHNNIRLVDATLHVRVTPDARHDGVPTIELRIPVFQNGIVEYWGDYAAWAPHESGEKSFDIATNGNPYGVGLYLIGVTMSLSLLHPLINDVIFYVAYDMEVET
jgi:hypothetical protein